MRPLAIDYAHDFAKVAPFFAGDPASPAAWRDAIARTTAQPRSRDATLAMVRAQQEARHAPQPARASAERLADARAVAIVTGQQAGLFGGPVFTLLKALTTIKLARHVEKEHGLPTVPIFWIDAEDHDWDEVSGCTVLDADLVPQTIRLGKPAGAGAVPVARVKLDGGITGAIEALSRTLAPTAFTEDIAQQLSRYYAPDTGMAHAFGTWLETLLGPLGLVVFDGADPAAKPLVRALFVAELEAPGQTAFLATEAGTALVGHGYHAQVTPSGDSVALFHLDGSREAIRRAGSGFQVGDRQIETTVLIAEAREHPERFSPNVLLRPLVQDSLFPTAAYVAGPNELAYLGQLRGVYERFGVAMPLMYPRATATILDSAAARFFSRFDVPLEALQPRDESALNRLLESQLPRSVEEALRKAEHAIEERMNVVAAALPDLDKTLEGAARSTLGKMRHELAVLHSKVIHAAKRRDDTLRRQFARAQALAFPGGDPQERALGFVTILNRVGPALIAILDRELPIDMGQHWVVTV
jgi:bacillithiol biosynthesis cysteine-adding enzyme BshC